MPVPEIVGYKTSSHKGSFAKAKASCACTRLLRTKEMLKRKRKHPVRLQDLCTQKRCLSESESILPPPKKKKIPPHRNLSKMMQFIFFSRITECENHKVSGRLKSDYVLQFCHKLKNILNLADSFGRRSYSTTTRESKLDVTFFPAAVSSPT